MSDDNTSLANQLLIALPALGDADFARSVTLICQHDAEGAMGVMVNRASEYTLGEVLSQMDIACNQDSLVGQVVLAGGPVHPERGFVLHSGDRLWDSTLTVTGNLAVTTSRDILEAIAQGDGPDNAVVALGCAGWGAGQLEQELIDNRWLNAPADAELLFELSLEARWQAAAGRIGVDLARLADYSGHA